MVEVLGGALLVASTVAMGLLAGLFYAFAVSVMPGLGRTETPTYLAAMQQINVAIINPWFFVSFFGAPVLIVATLAFHLSVHGWTALPWIVAALVLYAVAFVITIGVNIPLNDALAATTSREHPTDLAAIRARFESRWVRWNVARAGASTAALGCLTWALVLYGRVGTLA